MKGRNVILLLLVAAVITGCVSLELTHYFTSENYVQVDLLDVRGNTIIVGKNCTAIVAETSPERANSIRLGLEGLIIERPNTHDIFVDALKSFNITVDSITIDKFDGRYYYSSIYLESAKKVLRLDSKPSDAIAIALRADAPIYINKSLLIQVGEKVC